MSRRADLDPESRRLWARITGSVTPPLTRKAPRILSDAMEPPPAPAPTGLVKARSATPAHAHYRSPPHPPPTRSAPDALEPRLQRRLSRERDPIEARIDLHGHGRFQAEDALVAFLTGCRARGLRSVLVITGQGRRGGGVIRASVHEWLQAPALRGVVAGFAPAHRRHGGDGALYVRLRAG